VDPVALRSHYWGPNVMVVVGGALDERGANALATHLRHAQGDGDLIVDLWDVTRFERPAVEVFLEAKQRAEAGGWGFALVADPSGPCRDVIEAAGETHHLQPYTTRQEARAALQQG
jgi:anti-anti-sigma regulatory factor